MNEIVSFLLFTITPANFIYTVLFGLAILYWLTVIIGVFDLDMFDFDVDASADVDVNADADVDTGTSFQGVLHSLLLFFNFAEVPVMILYSFLSFFMWWAALIFQYYIGHGSVFWALVLFVPNFIVSMMLTKFCTQPFKGLFSKLNEEKEDYEELIGRVCVVTTSQVDDTFGQARIETQGSPLVINARSENGEVLLMGEEALVVAYDIKTGIAIIHRA